MKPKRKKPGPARGTVYQDADAIKNRLVSAAIKLLRQGTSIDDLTSLAITKCAKVDKMYVGRYFGSQDHLLFAATMQLLFTRTEPIIGTTVFRTKGSSNVDPEVVLLFQLYTHLARNPQLEPQLRILAESVLATYQNQLVDKYGLTRKAAARQAVLGLMAFVGYMSTGHLLPVPSSEIVGWVSGRSQRLKKNKAKQRAPRN